MRQTLLVPALIAVLASCFCGSGAPDRPAAAAPAPIDQDQRMAWWRQARFGLFVHWGLYAIPAGAWGSGTDHGEWIRTTARIPREEYARLQQQWRPAGFDADAWVRSARDAGMRYVVITSKHHDGFCLWDSDVTDWDVGSTPDGCDILHELAAACRRHGLRFCTYHSIMDWHHPDYLPRRDWETDRPIEGADFDRFERYLHAQVAELVARYQPAVMWFDGEWESTWNHERGVRLFELCRRLDPAMIVNNRVDVHRGGMAGFSQSQEAVGDFATPEQEIPATGLPGVDWESCMTMNRHWGFNAADTQWKSTAELVRNLIDIASKGGNYLLNVGPRADGSFPPEAIERLRGIGAWMQRHGEAIHGTTASVFDALPYGRCTVRAGADTSLLHLHVFERPADGWLPLPGLGNRVLRARVLGSPASALPLRAATSPAAGPAVHLPAAADPIATVVVVEIEGMPIVYRPPVLVAEMASFVTHLDVMAQVDSPELAVHYTLDGSRPDADSKRATGPIRLERTTTLRAVTCRGGTVVSDVVERTFARVQPLPPVLDRPVGRGLRRTMAAVDWRRIPDDRPALDGDGAVVPAIALPPRVGEHVALRFAGLLEVPRDEVYRFLLRSDDGSRLWIDERLVVDHDGLHGATERRGEIALGAGRHRIELVWFNRTGGAELELSWALPGAAFVPVPDGALSY